MVVLIAECDSGLGRAAGRLLAPPWRATGDLTRHGVVGGPHTLGAARVAPSGTEPRWRERLVAAALWTI